MRPQFVIGTETSGLSRPGWRLMARRGGYSGPMFDLVLQGGTVVDPASGVHGRRDVAVRGGLIADIGEGLEVRDAGRVVDVTGKVVTPGLIDLHAHVFDGVTGNGVQPDL